jgi:molybdopterin synthase sulfur carrier subunit
VTTRILFFGALRDKAGGGERSVELPPDVRTISALIDWLADDDPALKAALRAPSVRVAVDRSIAPSRDERLSSGKEIAFMPPFSGG